MVIVVDKWAGETFQEEYEETTIFKGGLGKRLWED